MSVPRPILSTNLDSGIGAASETENKSWEADFGTGAAAGALQLAAAPRSIFREGTEDFFALDTTGAVKDAPDKGS